MTSVTMSTADLRAALLAVAPHAEPDADATTMHRVRLDLGADVIVSASQRFTVGLAVVSVWDSDGEIEPVDLTPPAVKEVLALFKGKRSEGSDTGDTVRLDVDETHVTVTDSSGLFDGKSYRMPRIATDEAFPDLRRLVSYALSSTGKNVVPDRVVVNGKLLGLFTQASRAYGEALSIEPTGDSSALVISCGESFVGMLMPVRPTDEADAALNEWRDGWIRRLPDAPADPEMATRLAADARRQVHRIDLSEHDDEDDKDGGG